MRKILGFLQEVKAEFKNISWPKREALIQLTFVVISISIIISLILGGFDYLFTQSIAFLGQGGGTKTVGTDLPAVVTIAPDADTTPLATPSMKN